PVFCDEIEKLAAIALPEAVAARKHVSHRASVPSRVGLSILVWLRSYPSMERWLFSPSEVAADEQYRALRAEKAGQHAERVKARDAKRQDKRAQREAEWAARRAVRAAEDAEKKAMRR